MSNQSITRKHLKPVLKAAVNTLKQFIDDLEVERESPESSGKQIEASGTVTHIGITGHVSGSLQFEMDKETAKNIAGGMYKEPIDKLDEDAKAALREFVNITAGNAVTSIKQSYDDVPIDITPPSLLVGDNIQLSNDVSTSPVCIPLRTNYGNIIIDVALEGD